jgi:hypothetical protein
VSDELEGKDESNKVYIENKRGIELGSISICPWPALIVHVRHPVGNPKRKV